MPSLWFIKQDAVTFAARRGEANTPAHQREYIHFYFQFIIFFSNKIFYLSDGFYDIQKQENTLDQIRIYLWHSFASKLYWKCSLLFGPAVCIFSPVAFDWRLHYFLLRRLQLQCAAIRESANCAQNSNVSITWRMLGLCTLSVQMNEWMNMNCASSQLRRNK